MTTRENELRDDVANMLLEWQPSRPKDLSTRRSRDAAAARWACSPVMGGSPYRAVHRAVLWGTERVWRDLGHHFMEEAATYSAWQPAGQTSAVHSHATTVDELRAEGIYEVVTPAELAVIRRAVVLHLATVAELDDDSAEKFGAALAAIARLYLLHEQAQRRPQP